MFQIRFSYDNSLVYLANENSSTQAEFYDYGEGNTNGCVIKCSLLNGVITPTQYIFASDADIVGFSSYFGKSIAVSNRGLIVGTYNSKVSIYPDVFGEAYVFE